MQQAPAFCADVHLGKLARWLRMLGFDVVYRHDLEKEELIRCAQEPGRVLLSRDASFQKVPGIHFFPVITPDSMRQLEMVLRAFNLKSDFQPFSRCLSCNTLLVPKKPAEIWDKVPQNTRKYYQEFWLCPSCERVYWKGSHYERMAAMIAELKE